MSEPTETPQDQLLQCKTCMKEIPASEAYSVEASDYVSHYCGLECYEQWRRQSETPESSA